MQEINKKRKAIKIMGIILIVLLIPIIIYTAMVLDTNSVMQRAEQHFSGEIESDENDPLSRYNFNADCQDYFKTAVTTQYKIHRGFTWHNFKDGYICVKYYKQYFDENGKGMAGAAGVHAKWMIHKENGEWKVTKIIEAP